MIPRPGDRVKITGTMPNDPCPLPVGLTGTVEMVNATVRQIYVDWDEEPDGRKRSLILLTTDPFAIVGHKS